ncbi:efflux RND transporter periplasmic adaptor subunit [Phenylobacterium sp.]|uniref:efflux RND transporter periplasmic adaptor subunit n=1 Tax=Phenylobacterium sp. TaxID=1871053 RepID=UPI002E2FBD42|nr:efflux RND transporter periplasmic adaptor subunit [Phenylobacterium sp.]HEX4709310.1 efflux RND transporter periplasmic adaptor subunit [Phenylobacterium sp.]
MLVAVGVAVWVLTHRKKAPPPGPPAVPVHTATVVVEDTPLTISALGAAQAWNSATIRSQVSGMLLRVPVREGSDVRAGDLLAEIDARPFQALLVQAQGALTRDEATLANARVLLERDRQLLAQDSIARQDFDTQAALVKQLEGTVVLDKGVVQTAAINVGYCRITAPTAGRVGVRFVDPGNLVTPTDLTGLLILNLITPIAVTFTVPEGDFQRLANVSNRFHTPLAVQALSQETSDLLGSGELNIADNRVDPTTGTVTLKARFPNPSHQLWPGQFLNVKLVLQTLPSATLIPLSAVNRGPQGAFAYVVGAGSKVSVRPITVMTVQGDTAIIQSGLKAGEVVVTDGQLILKPGMKVTARPSAPRAAPPGGGGAK